MKSLERNDGVRKGEDFRRRPRGGPSSSRERSQPQPLRARCPTTREPESRVLWRATPAARRGQSGREWLWLRSRGQPSEGKSSRSCNHRGRLVYKLLHGAQSTDTLARTAHARPFDGHTSILLSLLVCVCSQLHQGRSRPWHTLVRSTDRDRGHGFKALILVNPCLSAIFIATGTPP